VVQAKIREADEPRTLLESGDVADVESDEETDA